MSIRIAAFDIGKKNFAFAVQEIDLATITEFNVKTLLKKGKIIGLENLDLTYNCKKCYLDPRTFLNMAETLDKFEYLWNSCDVFLIEQQMSFGKKRNTMALKLGQHCYSYFCIKYRDTKKVIEFPAYHKTQTLEAPKKFGKIEKKYKNGKTKMINDNIKKWSIRKAKEILAIREDTENLDKLENMKKQDDASDCILMIQAFEILEYLR